MSEDRQHLNSLGYVIGGKQSRALIAWGYDPSGRRIAIDDADRGGSQGLRCECKSLLVARKGEIREHHFAHKAGDVRYCEAAAKAALSTFIAHALLDARQVALPMTRGLTGHAHVHAVTDIEVEGFLAHLIDAQRDRKLLVYTRLKRGKFDALEGWCRRHSISGMVLDLTTHRNRTDDEIRVAIAELAPREWIYRSTHNDRQAAKRIVRRLYGL